MREAMRNSTSFNSVSTLDWTLFHLHCGGLPSLFACLHDYKGRGCVLNLCSLARPCIAFVVGAGGRRRKPELGHVEAHDRVSENLAGSTFYLFVRCRHAGSGVMFESGKRKQGQLSMLCSGAFCLSGNNHLGVR